MNPKDIIEASQKGRGDARIMWFLQSLALKRGGDMDLAAELERVLPEQFAELRANKLIGSFVSVSEALHLMVHGYNSSVMGGCGRRARELLLKYVHHTERAAAQAFYQTNIGREVWETLDWCLEQRRPCFIEGSSGRGKTTSARAWHEAHRSQSRYYSCSGLGAQRDQLYGLAEAYGVKHSGTKVPDAIVRAKLVAAIVGSGLVLIIDEAHHLLPDRNSKSRPRLIDFIDCDLCNAGVRVALISTPQFGKHLADYAKKTGWAIEQFIRRFSGRWRRLPDSTDQSDLVALAQKFLPGVGAEGIETAVNYAEAFGRDVSGMFDLIEDAKRCARNAGRTGVAPRDLVAVHEERMRSESAIAAAFRRPGQDPISIPADEPAEDLPSDSRRQLTSHRRGNAPVATAEPVI